MGERQANGSNESVIPPSFRRGSRPTLSAVSLQVRIDHAFQQVLRIRSISFRGKERINLRGVY